MIHVVVLDLCYGITLHRRLLLQTLLYWVPRTPPSPPRSRMSTRRFASLAADLLKRQEDGGTPRVPHHGSPVVAFIIGLAIVLLASILNAAGLNLTKLDHVRYFQTFAPAAAPPN